MNSLCSPLQLVTVGSPCCTGICFMAAAHWRGRASLSIFVRGMLQAKQTAAQALAKCSGE